MSDDEYSILTTKTYRADVLHLHGKFSEFKLIV